jgi:hypothetical protein
MATKMKALIGFAKMKDDELVIVTKTIIGAMSSNAKYPNPTPDLLDLETILEEFTMKLAVARKRGSPEDTALKNESREPLIVATVGLLCKWSGTRASFDFTEFGFSNQ